MFTADVVLPTPPFWFATATTPRVGGTGQILRSHVARPSGSLKCLICQ